MSRNPRKGSSYTHNRLIPYYRVAGIRHIGGYLVSEVDERFKAGIVHLILTHDAEKALSSLAEKYNVDAPRLRVGIPKGHVTVSGCYVLEKETIYVATSDGLADPFLILHEFYHHLRSVSGRHLGTERYADKFAREYINEYRSGSNP